ncbi:MAG: MFS transporter [Armatimonadetes bacterium]|nr:MFS transporter [Armatimonadota bacterium]
MEKSPNLTHDEPHRDEFEIRELSSLPPESPAERRATRVVLNSGWFFHWLALYAYTLPLNLFLKNKFNFTADQIAAFTFVTGFAWNVKPIAGWVSDLVPLRGLRRKPYFVVGAVLAALTFGMCMVVAESARSLMILITLANVGLVFVSSSLGGLMVEAGRRNSRLAGLSSERMVLGNVSTLIAGPLGGFLAGRWFGLTAGVCGASCGLLVVLAWLLLKEKPVPVDTFAAKSKITGQLRDLVRCRPFWWAMAMSILLYLAPGFTTPLLFHQQNDLKLSEQFIGNLGLFNGGAGIFAGMLCVLLSKRWTLRKSLFVSIAVNSVGTLAYLYYKNSFNACWIEMIGGFSVSASTAAMFALAGMAVPEGMEAMAYSVLMSLQNFMVSISDVIGSWLYDQIHVPFQGLVWINSGSTALVLLMIPLLPAILVDRIDHSSGEAAAE